MSPEAARGALMLGLRAKWRGVSQAGHPLFASASPVWLSAQALPDLREVGGVVGQGLCKAGGGGRVAPGALGWRGRCRPPAVDSLTSSHRGNGLRT